MCLKRPRRVRESPVLAHDTADCLFTLASALVLIGLGTLVAISIDRHFVELDRDALRDKIHLTREVIGNRSRRRI